MQIRARRKVKGFGLALPVDPDELATAAFGGPGNVGQVAARGNGERSHARITATEDAIEQRKRLPRHGQLLEVKGNGKKISAARVDQMPGGRVAGGGATFENDFVLSGFQIEHGDAAILIGFNVTGSNREKNGFAARQILRQAEESL